MIGGAKYEGPLFAREVEGQQLRDRIVELERALVPFANAAKSHPWTEGWDRDEAIRSWKGTVITVGHLWNAAEALKVRP